MFRLSFRFSLPRRVFAAVCLIALASGASGCGSDSVEPTVLAITQEAPAATAALRVPSEGPLGEVEVYTDLSLTMQPFLSPAAAPPVLPQVLEALDGGLGGGVDFYGFGFENDTLQTVDAVTVGTLLRADTYGRQNNDYAALFERFTPDSTDALGTVRVVLTDGVESDPEGGRRFGRVVGAVDDWIRAGGTFAAVLFRSGYSGRYYSESGSCPGGAFQMSCDNRPLVAFVFAPDVRSVDLLLSAIASASDGLSPETVVRVGGADARLRPLEEIAIPGERRGLRILRRVEDRVVAGIDPVVVARIDTRSADDNGFVPLTFELDLDPGQEPWARLQSARRDAFVESLRPRVRAWAVVSDRDTLQLEEIEVEARPSQMTVDSLGNRVTIPVRRPKTDALPGRVRQFAWLVELLPYENAPTLVPTDFSTTRDCDASTCGQTLNLVPLLGTILRDDYVAARAILLTEWRD